MNCRQARQLVNGFVEESLTESVRAELRAHLERCGPCRQLMADAGMTRDVLRILSQIDVDVPGNLVQRVKTAVRRAQDEVQIREGRPAAAIGSPAFIATCASLLVGAVMLYAVATRVYVGGESAGPSPGLMMASTPPGDGLVAVANEDTSGVAGYVRADAGPESVAVWTHAAARGDAGLRRSEGARATRVRTAAGSGGAQRAASSRERPVAQGAADSVLTAGAMESVKEEAVAVGSEYELASVGLDGPSDRASGGAEVSEPLPDTLAADPASRAVVAGLVAGVVVEKYVAKRIIEAEPTLLAVTTSVSSSGDTSLTDGTIR